MFSRNLGAIAQWLERRAYNSKVPGSTPGGPTSFIGDNMNDKEKERSMNDEFLYSLWRHEGLMEAQRLNWIMDQLNKLKEEE